MTAYVVNQTAGYDGSGNQITATGPATIVYSGTVSGGRDARLDIFVSAGGVDPFTLVETKQNREAFTLSLRNNDKFYMTLRSVPAGSNLSLHYNFG